MSKQFKQYRAYTKDSATGELIHTQNTSANQVHFTYPAEFSEKKVRGLVAAKLNRADDAVFVEQTGVVEFN